MCSDCLASFLTCTQGPHAAFTLTSVMVRLMRNAVFCSHDMASQVYSNLNYGTRTFCRKALCRKTLCRKTFAERTFCRRTLSRTDILSNGQYDERTFRRKDTLPKRQLPENREILGIVTHFSKMCNSQSLCNYNINIVRSLPYMTLHNGSLAAHNDYY